MTVKVPHMEEVRKPECWMATEQKFCKTKWEKVCEGSKTNSYRPYKCWKVEKQVRTVFFWLVVKQASSL